MLLVSLLTVVVVLLMREFAVADEKVLFFSVRNGNILLDMEIQYQGPLAPR